MGLHRLALRLAAIEGLRPANAAGPWPTLAGRNVFDSRIDPIEDIPIDAAVPTVCVYTEADEAKGSQKHGGTPFLHTVDLTFEIAHVGRVQIGDDPNVFDAVYAVSDSELEAAIDLIEFQIAFALFYAPPGRMFRELTRSKVLDPRSHPYRSSEEAARLSRRTVAWKVQLIEELQEASPRSEPEGLARLPKQLAAVFNYLPDQNPGKQLLAGLAKSVPVMPVRVPLSTVSISAQVLAPGARPTSKPVQGNLSIDIELDQE